MINAIIACDKNGGIAKNGKMPWPRCKEDLAFFKEMTKDNVVVMGSSTWDAEDMPSPLPNRTNVVATSQPYYYMKADAAVPFPGMTLEESIRDFDAFGRKSDVFIIGGSELLNSTLHMINYLYLTVFEDNYDCNTFINTNKILSDFVMIRGTHYNGVNYYVFEPNRMEY